MSTALLVDAARAFALADLAARHAEQYLAKAHADHVAEKKRYSDALQAFDEAQAAKKVAMAGLAAAALLESAKT